MLRQIQTDQSGLTIFPFGVTTPSTINFGRADLDFASIGSLAAGRINFNLEFPPRRFTAVAAVYTSVANGGVASWSFTGSQTVFLNWTDSTPTFAQGRGNALVFGGTGDSLATTTPHVVYGSGYNAARLCGARITSAGVVSFGSTDFSCNKTATGAYTVTFKRAFSKPPIVIPLADGTLAFPTIDSITETSCVIKTWNAAAVAADSAFHLMVYGGQGKDEIGRFPKPVMNSQRQPRLNQYYVTYSAGTPSYTIGGPQATGNPTDNGTGDFTITFAKPFRQIPVVAACTRTAGCGVRIVSVSTTSVRLLDTTAASAASDSDTAVIVLGSDDPSEY